MKGMYRFTKTKMTQLHCTQFFILLQHNTMDTFQMLFHIRLIVKPFFAHLTRKRSLPRMRSYVFLQFIVRTVRLITQMANELARRFEIFHFTNPMRFCHMYIQRTLMFVVLLAGGTFKRSHIRVRFNVAMQNRAIYTFSVAQMTREIPLPRVGFCMRVQVGFQGKTPLAVRTNILPFASVHMNADFVFVEIRWGIESFWAFLAMIRS